MGLAATQVQIEPADLEAGTRRLMIDAAFATLVGMLNSGVVLVAYALYLGASSAVVGLLAALPFLTQLLQAPTVLLSVVAVGKVGASCRRTSWHGTLSRRSVRRSDRRSGEFVLLFWRSRRRR